MKRSQFFMGLGALVLTVSAVFATKANKKFTIPSTAFYLSAPNTYLTALSSCSSNKLFTSTQSIGNIATIDGKVIYSYDGVSTYSTLYFQ